MENYDWGKMFRGMQKGLQELKMRKYDVLINIAFPCVQY